jgi:predicted RNA-binding protein with RPS1 domain
MDNPAALPDPEDGPSRAATSSCRVAPFWKKPAPNSARNWSGHLAEGQVRDGVVKNITDYGAFVDLGGIDGLLHVTDMRGSASTTRAKCSDHRRHRQGPDHQDQPGYPAYLARHEAAESIRGTASEAKYPVGAKYTGRVTNITDYGAFVELEAGIEGLVHVSEMSWTKKNVHPGKIVSTSQEVDVVVLDVDASKRRISLGLKQAQDNPWDAFVANNPIGSTVEGEVKNATEFGLFIGLDNDVDGMVHLSDLDWSVSGEEAIQRFTARARWSRPSSWTSTSRRNASRSASSSWAFGRFAGRHPGRRAEERRHQGLSAHPKSVRRFAQAAERRAICDSEKRMKGGGSNPVALFSVWHTLVCASGHISCE